jgi:hypothetical protein
MREFNIWFEIIFKIFDSGENDKRVDPSVGPIILPPSLETIENSDTEEDEDDSKECIATVFLQFNILFELMYNLVRPAPNRAGNCHSLAHLCHQHSYRRLLQRSNWGRIFPYMGIY